LKSLPGKTDAPAAAAAAETNCLRVMRRGRFIGLPP